MASAKKNSLSLQTKVDILQEVERLAEERGSKVRIATKFSIPKSTLSTIIKNKDSIIEAYEQSSFAPSKKRMRTAAYPEVEEALVSWLKFARSQNTPISGPVLQTKAEELATEFGYDDFKCSTGWLSRFKVRHDIVFRKLCGESAVVDEEIASSWKEQLESILTDYEPIIYYYYYYYITFTLFNYTTIHCDFVINFINSELYYVNIHACSVIIFIDTDNKNF